MKKIFVLEKKYYHGNKTMSDKKEKDKRTENVLKHFVPQYLSCSL